MKTILSTVTLLLLVLSAPTWADKIMITGEPVMLEQRDDMYYLPKDYTSTTSYHYVSLNNGDKMVCYEEAQPALKSLKLTLMNVEMNGQKVQWTCYPWDETYFQMKQ